jgi:hypothetical protein
VAGYPRSGCCFVWENGAEQVEIVDYH